MNFDYFFHLLRDIFGRRGQQHYHVHSTQHIPYINVPTSHFSVFKENNSFRNFTFSSFLIVVVGAPNTEVSFKNPEGKGNALKCGQQSHRLYGRFDRGRSFCLRMTTAMKERVAGC